jgi:hypothetical protein
MGDSLRIGVARAVGLRFGGKLAATDASLAVGRSYAEGRFSPLRIKYSGRTPARATLRGRVKTLPVTSSSKGFDAARPQQRPYQFRTGARFVNAYEVS